jgi:Cu+-exporting ATPase
MQKHQGDSVTGGTINQTGSFVMVAERVGEQTTLARIVHMVNEAQRSRAPIQRLADRVAGYFVPAVFACALLAFLGWLFWGPEPRLAQAVINAVAVLIIACPCALGLATPMSIMVGVGRGAQEGILIKDASALEKFGKIDTLVIDKTGTLTEGHPRVTRVESFAPFSEDEILGLAASLEQSSEHPLARAVMESAKERKLALEKAEDFQSVTGAGVTGKVQNRAVAIGNHRLLETSSIPAGSLEAVEKLRGEGSSVMFVGVDNQVAGWIAVSDPIKDTAREALQSLAAAGIRVVMVTGDQESTARAVAGKLGIEEFHADVDPAGKHAIVSQLQSAGRKVAVAGDGVNDAPALAQADVGIAMENGTDVALESADITLLRGDLRGLARASRLSQAVMKNIRQNLFFAFIYNCLGIPVAAGALYPVSGLLLNPMIASAAMSFSSLSVVMNALRLKTTKL